MGDTARAESPTVRRMALGVRLRGHRERVGYTLKDVGREVGRDPRSVARWEAGEVDIGDMLEPVMDLYRIDPAERAELGALARDSATSGWWEPYSRVIRPTYQRFIGLEEAATGLDEYAAKLVPGLLQTTDYMRAVMKGDDPPMPPDVIRQRILIREKRQAEWDTRGVPTRYLIDESVLRRMVGSRAIMARQLKVLADAAQRPNVILRVCSFDKAPRAASTLGGFAVMSFEVMPPVAVVEGLVGDLYADRAEAEKYTQHFRALAKGAETGDDSLAMIEETRGRFL
jgi:transcriptional regulator with XRE-family HTH domain